MTDTIFTPYFDLTPHIRSSLEDTDRKAWLIERVLLMPKHETWIRREVSVRRAAGTTAIEDVGLPEQAVAELLSQRAAIGNSEAEQANINALRAYEFVDYLSDQQDVALDELVVRELNRQFMYGVPDVLTPGAYRKGQNSINSFTPPDQGDVPALMRGLGLWLRNEHDGTNPILRAGLAHLHFVAIHPFWDGNGRTARGLATLIIQRSDMHFRKLLSLEQTFASNRDGYINAIEKTLGGTFAAEYDATPWLEFWMDGVNDASSLLENQLTDWHRTMEEAHRTLADLGLKERQADALVFATRSNGLTRKDYMEITNVRALTASRDLADLVRRGLLTPHGRTRDRTYTLRMPEPPRREGDPA
jgi:Fic family protein